MEPVRLWAAVEFTARSGSTEAQAAALARLQSLQALYAAWPDAERIARKEDCTVNDGKLNYTVTYTIVADICG